MLNLELNALDKIQYTVCIGNKNITTSTFFLHSFWKSVGEPLRINSHTHKSNKVQHNNMCNFTIKVKIKQQLVYQS